MPDDRLLSDYRLGELFGAGVAEVRRAEPLDAPGTSVVLKIARTPAAVEMLRREAWAAARFDHPRVLRPMSVHLDHDPPFAVFARLRGGTLSERLRLEHGVSAPEAARIFDELLEGLAALHAAGIAHGDLKPENILLDADGRAVIADLGLAVIAPAGGWARSPGGGKAATEPAHRAAPAGTWHFMAPEVRAGAAATPASDVYAAGLVLSAMLGQHPVPGVLDAGARAELPEWAARVIEAACVEAEHRPADGGALRALFASVRPARGPVSSEGGRRRPRLTDKRTERPASGGAEAGFAEAARSYKLRLDPPKSAQSVGAWVLDEPIGRSRFGELWKARRRDRAGEVAAVKLFSEPRFLSNLRADHTLAGNLRHPNVAVLLEAELHGERPYVVMEYVDGTPLRQRLRAGPLPPRQALSILEQVLSGLSAAHALGLAHRNLKPENVLLIDMPMRDGARRYPVKITDFGLGKAVEETVCQMSMSGIDWSEFAPYWRYLSPEQEAGDSGTAVSDVYSAGLIYYEMLIGCLPPAVLRDEALADLPGRIRPVLTRALAPVERRFGSAAEFLAALREAVGS